MAFQIPAWMLATYVGTKMGGELLGGLGREKDKKAQREEDRKRWVERLNLENKKINMDDQHFRAQMRQQEDMEKSKGPANIVNMLTSIGNLRRTPAGTSDILKGLF